MTYEPPNDPLPPPSAAERVEERPRPRPTAVIAGAALAGAFLVGLVIGWQVLGGDDEAGAGGEEADTAELACAAFAKIDIDAFFAEDASPLDDGTLYLIQGASSLGQAAAAESDAYGELAERSETIQQSLARFDRDGAIEAADDITEECGDLFPE